jgi:hypothetical protein
MNVVCSWLQLRKLVGKRRHSLRLVSCVGSLARLVAAYRDGFSSGPWYGDNIGGGYRPLL